MHGESEVNSLHYEIPPQHDTDPTEDSSHPRRYTMSGHKRLLLLSTVLSSFLFCGGIQSEALAHGGGGKLTICVFPTHGNAAPKTMTLPTHVAQRFLALNPNNFTGVCGGTKFVIVAVSGTLEEGFPLRPNLDFITEVNEGNPPVLAIFLGHALVRGVKAFLDIKDSNSREFQAPPTLNPINPALVASGNNDDANISSIYLVDRRQAVRALLREPRYLSMVPDLGKVDIDAPETSPDLRKLLRQAIQEDTTILAPKNTDQVTFLQVISTWKSCHFVPSPVLTMSPNGTRRVTDFPNSLAMWAGTTDAERISNPASYNAKVEAKIRATLAASSSEPGSDGCTDNPSSFPAPVAPDTLTHYAVDKHTKRMNDAYRPCQFQELAARAGLNIQVEQCPN
jgi:hypothetical protein